ncbi:hypothetical protein VTN00DRAFT_4922 [Thermoascus crustaceus]|uniref:uncharacterized protein n=1 Tax=Thermoascus crustaceus TaxID=5088 RepID=UPI00374344E4
MLLQLITLQPSNLEGLQQTYLLWLDACCLRLAILSLSDISRSLCGFQDQFDVGGLSSRLPEKDSLPKVRKQEPWMDLGDLTFVKPLFLRTFKRHCGFHHQANV